MRHSNRNNRGFQGIAILAVLGIFLAIHLIAPQITLWPALLITLAVVTMVVSHATRRIRPDQALATSPSERRH